MPIFVYLPGCRIIALLVGFDLLQLRLILQHEHYIVLLDVCVYKIGGAMEEVEGQQHEVDDGLGQDKRYAAVKFLFAPISQRDS